MDMPQAEAYLVCANGVRYLEDRFDRNELWLTQSILGRWMDEDGRTFILSQLDTCPPAVARSQNVTRGAFAAQRRAMPRVRANADFPAPFIEAVSTLAPCSIVENPRSPRQLTRGFKQIYYWQHPTNYTSIVCSFLPEETNVWYLATWKLAEGDDYPAQMTHFENEFLRYEFTAFLKRLPILNEGSSKASRSKENVSERERLRVDAHHSIAAYPSWHFTGSEEFAILDNLSSRAFVEAVTNDLTVMRPKFAAALPTPLDGTNVLCVTRIYSNRDEYQDALEAEGMTNMMWSAAYWSPQRRELVAYLTRTGEAELLRTIRHESFHQYLSYATSMISVSPWLNEGYAQYFEDELDAELDLGFKPTEETIERLSAVIPALLYMDYEQFYGGTDDERRMKYRLAWSIAYFLEKRADQIRLKPFAGIKERYLNALLETHDMRQATASAFKDTDLLKHFIAEWRAYWMEK